MGGGRSEDGPSLERGKSMDVGPKRRLTAKFGLFSDEVDDVSFLRSPSSLRDA
jgi:hypothetical protein